MAEDSNPIACVCLTGPTATGKTELALKLAKSVPIEVVSMDSALVYRGMDIGTAKPSLTVREDVPHHLIDILDPGESYSAGRFVRDASRAIREIAAGGRVPVIVGGTHLYLRALRDGLAELPRADPALRERLDAEAAASGWPALHTRLSGVDPEAAHRIAPSDGQRIQRALEVFELTGEPLSAQQRHSPPAADLAIRTVALMPDDRALLAERIERRFDVMVAKGFVEEVERLRARDDLTPETPSMRAVGYRQLWRYLDGDYDWETAKNKALAATRQLAKRQMTALRSDVHAERFRPGDSGLVGALERRVQQRHRRLGAKSAGNGSWPPGF
ncbi:MAG TPA: tRNA (adenosine(37)-N6)-dimethylallyltransferase MiaA [Gammaproteobacteria bacterium]